MTRPFYNEDGETLLEGKTTIRRPPRYRVLLLNDDYSTFDFVVKVLCTIFHKTPDEAIAITQAVHEQGQGVCGYYPWEIAETKVDQVATLAQREGHPLRAIMEEE